MIEADRLSNPDGRPDSDALRGGVEIDKYGAADAYWVRKYHPGDAFLSGPAAVWSQFKNVRTLPGGAYMGTGTWGYGGEWERIPARTSWGRRRVIHVFRQAAARSKPGRGRIWPR